MTLKKLKTGCPRAREFFWRARFGWRTRITFLGRTTKRRSCSSACCDFAMMLGFCLEYDPEEKCFIGNFPQAFSHVGLVNTIINLNTQSGPARQRSGSHGRGRSDKPPL